MSKLAEFLIRKAKNNNRIKKMYNSTVNNYLNTHIGEITPFNPRETTFSGKRVNLLVPSINKEHIFGGISTAINFFEEIVSELDCKARIILTDAAPEASDLAKYDRYQFVKAMDDSKYDFEIVAFNDRFNKSIPIGKDDVFIATAWWTAYFVQRIAAWQSQVYNQPIRPMIYFIQDFEPGFYAWSSQYVLAESTYKYSGPQYAIFNSSLLKDFFDEQGYAFTESYVFEPRLNESLKLRWVPLEQLKKKKKIMIYGRPSVARNAFTVIIETLRLWVWSHPNASEWEIISAGEQHQDIEIGNGVIVRSKGKMTLDEYADELKECAVGISLMISPHPSYPPLEMAHFGMLVLTNNYANKDLSKWHDNITSAVDMSPDTMAEKLSYICMQFENNSTLALDSSKQVASYSNDTNKSANFEIIHVISNKF